MYHQRSTWPHRCLTFGIIHLNPLPGDRYRDRAFYAGREYARPAVHHPGSRNEVGHDPVQRPGTREPGPPRALSRLSEASLRINESLEFDTVLQEVLDSARLLSGASYGVITLFNDSGAVAAFLASGITPEEAEGVWAMADGPQFLEHLRSLAVPVRTAHLTGYAHSIGLADFSPLAGAGAFMS